MEFTKNPDGSYTDETNTYRIVKSYRKWDVYESGRMVKYQAKSVTEAKSYAAMVKSVGGDANYSSLSIGERSKLSRQDWSVAMATRQARRDSSGRYEDMLECELCGKHMGSEYYSDRRVDTGDWGNAGICLCAKCCKKLDGMSDADAWFALTGQVRS